VTLTEAIDATTRRPLLYVGVRGAYWNHAGFPRPTVLYLTRGGRWNQLALHPSLTDAARPPGRRLHSPDGFNWSYGGSGPAELARHLLWHATGRVELLDRPDLYQTFKRRYVVAWEATWMIAGDEIREWVAAHDRGQVEDPPAPTGEEDDPALFSSPHEDQP
jgi:hypothetical protein